jgi:hypothetical protein
LRPGMEQKQRINSEGLSLRDIIENIGQGMGSQHYCSSNVATIQATIPIADWDSPSDSELELQLNEQCHECGFTSSLQSSCDCERAQQQPRNVLSSTVTRLEGESSVSPLDLLCALLQEKDVTDFDLDPKICERAQLQPRNVLSSTVTRLEGESSVSPLDLLDLDPEQLEELERMNTTINSTLVHLPEMCANDSEIRGHLTGDQV